MLQDARALMPITFKSLVIENTTRCNAKCAMCYQAAGPKGSDILGDAKISENSVERVLNEAASLPTVSKRFHLSGGEAFMGVNEVLHLFNRARLLGFTNISTTTNCFWGNSSKRADDIAKRCRDAGLTSVEISWDHWHMAFVNPQSVDTCIEAFNKYQIRSNLRLLTSRKHSVGEALSYLAPSTLSLVDEISSCPVFPTGRAEHAIPIEEIFSKGSAQGSCHHMLNLTINALGNVAPCCAGADQTEGLSFGNIHEQPLHEIVSQMSHSPMLRTLVFQGPASINTILEENGVSLQGDFVNPCHLCSKIFSQQSHYQVIHDHFDQKVDDALNRALIKSGYSQASHGMR